MTHKIQVIEFKILPFKFEDGRKNSFNVLSNHIYKKYD